MVKQNIITQIFLGIILMFTLSCSEQVDISPVSSISVASFWESPDDARGAVSGMYSELRAIGQDLFYMGELRAGQMEGAPIRNAIGYLQYFTNVLTAANADMGWQQPYKVISTANLIIANVPNIEFPDESEKNNIIAQAYTMRAYIYFILARTWGDAPLITEPLTNFSAENTFVERSPVQEVFEQIKADLEDAIGFFPNNDFPTGRNHWSRPAANMLKGKVHLWTGKQLGGGDQDFTTALEAFEAVETANVQLLDNYSGIFDYENKGNDEIIFAIHYNELEGGNNFYYRTYPQIATINNSSEATQERLNPGGWGVMGLAEHIRDQFDDDDIRKDATFYELYTYSGSDSTYYTSALVKFDGLVVGSIRMFIDDIIVQRYADLLLLKAEAKNALDQDPSTEINMIRERAYDANFAAHEFVSGTQEENDEAILQERLFELAYEGTRWWDLVRFGKAYELVPSLQGRENEAPILFPLPEETLTRNTLLSQNLGY